MGVEIVCTVSGEFLEDQDTGVSPRFLLSGLKQIDCSRDLVIHKVFAERGTPNFGNFPERFGGRQHEVHIGIRKQGLDIVIEPKQIPL